MIKTLFLITALLVPGLASAANPSAPFSDQVVPVMPPPNGIACDIGPPYTGTIPAAAQAAGFTHCAVNYDFTQTSSFTNSAPPGAGGGGTYQWSNLASWVNGCGASHPLLYISAGCGQYSILSDNGTPVFDIVANTTFSASFGSAPAAIHDDQHGYTVPQNAVYDFVWRQMDQQNGQVEGSNYDLFLYTQSGQGNQGPYNFSYQEMDFTESIAPNDTTAATLFSAGCHEWSGNWCGSSLSNGGTPGPAPIVMGNYNEETWRMMVSADGTVVAQCMYVNGGSTFKTCSSFGGYACNTFNVNGNGCIGVNNSGPVQAPTQYNRFWIAFDVGNYSGSPGGPIEERFQRFTVWVGCSDWNDPAHLIIANDYGTGAHQCGWSTPIQTP